MCTMSLLSSNVVLIGMPGSGKSTIGQRLSRRLNAPFTDTDDLIEKIWGATLQEIIDHEGVDVFRRREEEVILSLRLNGHVISTGGSVVYYHQAMMHLGKLGKIVWLDLPFRELERRLETAMEGRGVLISEDQTLFNLFQERNPLYERYAEVRIINSGREVYDVIREIVECVSDETA